MKNLLALDLGTKTGYAARLNEKEISGTWQLATPSELTAAKKLDLNRREDCRPCELVNRVRALEKEHETIIELIIFEDVEFMKFQLQAQLWASLRTAVWILNCIREVKIELQCLNVSELKKFGSGVGNATKEQMSMALALKHPDKYTYKPVTQNCFLVSSEGRRIDDNEVDALHLLAYAKLNYDFPKR